jgi:pilus assembly protein CpaF
MTAFTGGERPLAGAEDRMTSVVARPESEAAANRPRPRPLDQIFPLRGDANRGREMQATWRSFCRDRATAVKAVLGAGRKPSEIAYQLGELLHNHFRTRGVTLASSELRRLVAELLTLYGPTPPENTKAGQQPKLEEPAAEGPVADKAAADDPVTPRPVAEVSAVENVEKEEPAMPVVAFDGAAPDRPRPGEAMPAAPAAPPVAAEKALEPPPPPPPAATAVPREVRPFERLLARTLELARGRMVTRDRTAARAAVDAAVALVASEQGAELQVETRDQLVTTALGEMIGLGLIDRLWADRSVRAVYVNGPTSVFVEREGTLQPVGEGFRDQAHLLELVTRLVGQPDNGMADFTLRDGTSGFVVFPPVAPHGPVFTLRRAEPGQATLERLLATGAVDRTIAELMRLAIRSRLAILISGPRGSGKTALLAGFARDLDDVSRVVTVARHRHFSWPVASKVELVTSPATTYGALVSAGERLEPALLVMDDVQPEDVPALWERLQRTGTGTLAAVAVEAMSPALARTADLVVRLDRGDDGRFRVLAVEDRAGVMVLHHDGRVLSRGTGQPAFAAAVQEHGYGAALAELLR